MEDRALLQHVLDAPGEHERLIVYSDWLLGRGDRRGEYLRLQVELKTSGPERRSAVLADLRRAYPAESPVWCGKLEQAGAIEANLLDLPERWWGVGLGARAAEGTYQAFSYREQPPLPVDRFGKGYEWLKEARSIRKSSSEENGWRAHLEALKAGGRYVPAELIALMIDGELQQRIPSCTDNYFLGAEDAELHPQPENGSFLTFYSDSQSCLLWGVRLGSSDEPYAPVLAGPPQFPSEEDERGEDEPYLSFPHLTFQAPTLEAFLYRWWLENTIWFATNWDTDRRALTAEEQAYLDDLDRDR